MSHKIPIVSPERKREFSSHSVCRSCDGLVNFPLSHIPKTCDSFSCRCACRGRGGGGRGCGQHCQRLYRAIPNVNKTLRIQIKLFGAIAAGTLNLHNFGTLGNMFWHTWQVPSFTLGVCVCVRVFITWSPSHQALSQHENLAEQIPKKVLPPGTGAGSTL